MITIEEDFLRQLMTPLPLTDDRGRVFMINDAAAHDACAPPVVVPFCP